MAWEMQTGVAAVTVVCIQSPSSPSFTSLPPQPCEEDMLPHFMGGKRCRGGQPAWCCLVSGPVSLQKTDWLIVSVLEAGSLRYWCQGELVLLTPLSYH